jgi:hypothetical protein
VANNIIRLVNASSTVIQRIVTDAGLCFIHCSLLFTVFGLTVSKNIERS